MSLFRSLLVACAVLAVAPAAALADTELAGDQFVTGSLCAGAECVDGDALATLPYLAKNNNTPGLAMRQTGTGAYAPYAWDVAGNETNFFIRDVTNGSRLPFRMFPGVITNQLRMDPNGETLFTGSASEEQSRTGIVAVPANRDVLTPLRTLPFQTFSITGTTTPHVGPVAADFNTAFGVGTGTEVSYLDASTIALLAARQLDTRLAALETDPTRIGPAGPAGPAGPVGPAGPAGQAGAAGAQGTGATSLPEVAVSTTGLVTAAQLAIANGRIAQLQLENRNQTRRLDRMQAQVNALVRAAK